MLSQATTDAIYAVAKECPEAMYALSGSDVAELMDSVAKIGATVVSKAFHAGRNTGFLFGAGFGVIFTLLIVAVAQTDKAEETEENAS